MAKTKRLFKSFYRLLFPVVILLALALVGGAIGILYKTSEPQKFNYLVTPEKYGRLSASGARVSEETWTNADRTQARGWLLRGAENSPAVVLLHRYGADRSYVLNLGVKINEATGFTILMPDLRGHGANPPVRQTTFGGCETTDAQAAIQFLRGLKSENQNALVGQSIGIYGVDLGALVALQAAAKDETIKAVALDSVPESSDAVLASAVDKKFPFASALTAKLAETGARAYFYNGCYRNDSLCDAAKQMSNRQILLLAGADAPAAQTSTEKLARCFPAGGGSVEAKLDLNPSGYGITNASLEQSEAYDQRVIQFFKQNLQ